MFFSKGIYTLEYILKDIMSYIATEIVRLRPLTKERFINFVGDGRTADRAMNVLLDKAKVSK